MADIDKLNIAGTTYNIKDSRLTSVDSIVKYWNPVVKPGTWSRICYLYGVATVGEAGILNFRLTWNSVVCNAMFAIVASHNTKVSITQLCNTSYSNFSIRGVVNNSGEVYIEINVPENSYSGTSTFTGYAAYLSLGNLQAKEYYTTFVDGSTVPANFTAGTAFKTSSGAIFKANDFIPTGRDEILAYYNANNGKMDVKVWKYQQGDNSPGISDFSMAALASAPGYHSTIDYTSTTSSWSGGEPWASVATDYYWCMYTQWVYMTAAVDIPATCTHDDAAAVFVNGTRIGYASSTTTFSVCFHLDQGWNKLQWLWYEHGGGAYCTTSINFAARSDCLYAVPEKKSFSAFID